MEKNSEKASKKIKIDNSPSLSRFSPEIAKSTSKLLSPKETRLDKLLAIIKNGDADSSYSSLVKIRTKVINVLGGVELFKRRGGLKVLVSVLQKAHKKCVDVALSVLGNCCLDAESRTHFRRWGGLPPLVNILHTFIEDSILARACRTIGNLAKEPKSATEFHEYKIAYFLSAILLSSQNEETLRMVLRALQNLGDSKEHCTEIGHSLGLSNTWKVLHKSEDVETLKSALKTILFFTKKCPMTDDWGRVLVAGDDGGKGIARLVDLTQISNSALAQQALKLLSELVEKSEVRPWLVNPHSLEKLVHVVDQGNPSQRGWSTHLGALCLLGRENTVHLRQAGGIPLLVRLLHQKEVLDYDPKKWLSLQRRVFNSLLAFEHDHPSLELLLENNIVQYLRAQLDHYVNPANTLFSVENVADIPAKTQETCTGDSSETEQLDLQGRGPRFRISSPSYQAVQQEFGQLVNKSRTFENEPLNIFDVPGRWSWTLGLDSPSSSNSSYSSLSDSESVTSSLSFQSQSGSHGPDSPSPCDSDSSDWNSGGSSGFNSPPVHFSPLRPSSADNDDLESHYFSSVDEDEELLREKSIFAIDLPLVPSKPKGLSGTRMVNHVCLGSEVVPTVNICLMNVQEQHYCLSWPQYDPECSLDSPNNQLERELADWALCLLNHLSWLTPFPPQLCQAKLIPLLLQYLSTKPAPNPRAAKLLARLATCPKYFSQLVAQNEIPLISGSLSIPDVHCCTLATSLHDLQISLQKGWQALTCTFGRGEILYLLQKGTSEERLAAALSTPFLVTSPTLLHHIMVKKNALELLFQSITAPTPPTFTFLAFRELGLRLNFKRLLLPVSELAILTTSPCKLSYSSENTDVSFQFDDMNQVQMRRSVLSSSPVLAAMLGPHFLEAHQSVIHLRGINSSSFEHFYHFLADCGHVYREAAVEELIEMWQLADRYLVPSQKLLQGLVQKACSKSKYLACCFAETSSRQLTEEGEGLVQHLLAYFTLSDWPGTEKASLFCDNQCTGESETLVGSGFGPQWRSFVENELYSQR